MSNTPIPIINVADLANSLTLRQLDVACRQWGCFQIVGHGIDIQTMQQLLTMMQRFFALSAVQKQAIARTKDNHWGYYDQELTKNRLDQKEIFDYGLTLNHQLQPQWPGTLPGFKTIVQNFYTDCHNLAMDVLGAIAVNLGVGPTHLQQHFYSDHTSFLRLNYYPISSQHSPEDLGIHPHTDAGALTLLLQDEIAGLEFLHKGRWLEVTPIEHAITVNLGDIIQVWSNDRYQAPLHRVRASRNRARYSAPFFLNPSFTTNYQPLASTIDAAHPAAYQNINWGQFRASRALGDYQQSGEDIQISDFKFNQEF